MVKRMVTVKHLRFATRQDVWRKRVRCEALVKESTARWRTFAGKDDRCELGARYSVNGRKLCARHAGEECIRLLVKGEEIIK